MNQTNSGPLAKALKEQSDPGTLQIYAAHYHGGKGGTQEPVKDQDTFSVIVVLQPIPEPGSPVPQMVQEVLYPNLNLAGQVHTSAGDPKLAAALKKLVSEALPPLEKLNEGSGQPKP